MNQSQLTKSERARFKQIQKHRNDASRGKYKPEFKPYEPPIVWRPEQSEYPSSENFPTGAVTTTTIMDRLHEESPEVQQAIIAKSRQIAPAYNKGPYMMIPENEVQCIGKK